MIVLPTESIGSAAGTTTGEAGGSAGSTGTPSKAAYRGDIDGLRAVAVTLVVLFHIGWGAFPAGYVGVDVFYVISGYLITGLLIRELSTTGTISIAGFYARRIRRLLPLSAVVLLATAVGSHFLTPTLDRPGVGSDIRAAALYFANWHFAGEQTQYMADTSKSPVLHYWSLSVEEQFYVVWPLLLLLVVGTTGLALRRWEIARRRIVLALGIVAAASFVLSATTSVSSGPWAYFGLHTRGWELAVGAGLALAGSSLARLTRVQAIALGWVGLVLVIGSAVLMSGDTIFPGTAAAFPVFGTAMVMGAGVTASSAGVGRFLSLPGPRYVGRISYAWYLWHWPCIVLIGGLNDDAAGAAGDQAGSGGMHDALQMAAAVVLSLALSVLTHHVVENPARRSPRLVGNRRLSLVLGVVLTGAGVAGSVLLVPAVNGGGGTTVDGISVESALKARTDLEPVPNGCYQELATSATPHDCQFGDPDGKRTIVLAGDSNARHWFGAYQRAAKARHWKFYFWGKSGCPMVDAVIWLGSTRSAYDSCTTWRNDVRDEIERLGTVDAVVLARSRALGRFVMVDSENRAKKSELEPTWEKDVATTLDELAPLTRHIVFMKPTPTAALDVPACIADGPETARSRCAFPQGPAIRDTPLDRAEDSAIQGRQGVSMLDVNQRICGADPCPAISDTGKIIYFNENHLTATFARTLSPVLARGLQAALGSDRSDATQ